MAFEIIHLKNKVYYSQNREDLLLEMFFPDVKDGFYVDIGAYDPDYDSVTKLFYKKGWSGINVEPQRKRYQAFVRKRKRDINLNYGVSKKAGTLTLREYENEGLSTFSNELKREYEGADQMRSYEDVQIPVQNLQYILSKYAKQQETIHFLKVDVEGLEYEVLTGNDWNLYRPQVICIEANHKVKDWKSFILSKSYEYVFFDGINDYYADIQSGRGALFDYAGHILMTRGGGIGYNDYRTIEKLHNDFVKSLQQINSLEGDIIAREEIISDKGQEIQILNQLLNNPRILLRKAVRLTIDRIHDTIRRHI